jgi:hypothetical protein
MTFARFVRSDSRPRQLEVSFDVAKKPHIAGLDCGIKTVDKCEGVGLAGFGDLADLRHEIKRHGHPRGDEVALRRHLPHPRPTAVRWHGTQST